MGGKGGRGKRGKDGEEGEGTENMKKGERGREREREGERGREREKRRKGGRRGEGKEEKRVGGKCKTLLALNSRQCQAESGVGGYEPQHDVSPDCSHTLIGVGPKFKVLRTLCMI